jgi:hypothetical protein
MGRAFNENLLRTVEISKQMLELADRGDQDRNDNSCGILYGILRDCAYRLKDLAEKECEKHKISEKWDI